MRKINRSDFARKLEEFGKWSRGGYPLGYKSQLSKSKAKTVMISDDDALEIDNALAIVQRRCSVVLFKQYYMCQRSVRSISFLYKLSRDQVLKQIEDVEDRLLLELFKE